MSKLPNRMGHTSKKVFQHRATWLIVLFVFVATGVALNISNQATALDGNEFQPGYIISNKKFTDNSTMSKSRIQEFLNNKNSTCLKNFDTHALYDNDNDGLGDEPYGDKNGDGDTNDPGEPVEVKASKLIKQASQIYEINPQVLLVTLQKEQGLVTRDDCPDWRYETAMGYGCPDSEPCDDSAYGFTRQVDYGSYHFKGYYNDSLSFVPFTTGKYDIDYHPDDSCGNSEVNIINQATASLYSYTPYQPNKAALDNLYGTGDSCSSYGNRNFWRIFHTWFGSPTFPLLFNIDGNDPDKVYLAWEDYYYHVASPGVIKALNLDEIPVETVSSSDLGDRSEGPQLESVVKFKDNPDPVYQIDNRKLYHFAGLQTDGETYASGRDVFNAYGYSNPGAIAEFPASLKRLFHNKDSGDKMSLTMSAIGKDRVYFVKNNKKHPIPTRKIYENMRENIDGNVGCPVYNQQPRARLSSHMVGGLDTGSKRRMAVSNGDPNYLVVGGKLRQLGSARQERWNLKDEVFTTLSDECKQKFDIGEKIQSNAVRVDGGDKVYKIVKGVITLRHHLASREALDSYTDGLGSVINLSGDIANLIPSGSSKLYAPGKIVKHVDKDPVYKVIGQFSRRHITSKELLKAYGLTFDDVIRTNSFQRYSNNGRLYLAMDDNGSDMWLIDKGVKRLMSVDIQDQYPNIIPWDTPEDNMVDNSITKESDLNVYVRGTSNPDPVYKIEDGKKRKYESREAFENDTKVDWDDIIQLSDPLLDPIPVGTSISG